MSTTSTERRCACGSKLSRFNPGTTCASCEARIEIGGARIPVPRRGPGRELRIDRSKPTTEGGVPLPGRVVVTPERSLEDMLRKPERAAAPPKPACADCGAELPKGHEGRLCRLCVTAAGLSLAASISAPVATNAPEKPSRNRTVSTPCRKKGCPSSADPSTVGKPTRNRWSDLCSEHLEAEKSAARAVTQRVNQKRYGAPPSDPTPVGQPAEDPTPAPAPLDLPPTRDLDAELTRLELELDHIAGEQTRLYARWRVANTRWSEVIAAMAAQARRPA